MALERKLLTSLSRPMQSMVLYAWALLLVLALVSFIHGKDPGTWHAWPALAGNQVLWGAIIIGMAIIATAALCFVFVLNQSFSNAIRSAAEDLAVAEQDAERSREIAKRIEAQLPR
jgi:hypothetical protein